MEPKDIAPLAKRFRIFSTGSTSSIGMAGLSFLNSSKLLKVAALLVKLLAALEYFLNVS